MPAHVPPAVSAALSAGGVPAALAALNARTSCRYTALYTFAGPMLQNLHLFDRLDAAATQAGPDIPVEASYCVYVRRDDRPFVTADALADLRAAGHPEQRELRAYAGVPVRDGEGRAVGSLCHFDPDPCEVPAAELDVMEAAAALFAPAAGVLTAVGYVSSGSGPAHSPVSSAAGRVTDPTVANRTAGRLYPYHVRQRVAGTPSATSRYR